jgi:thiol-disulfide isomerase/thioredoxin
VSTDDTPIPNVAQLGWSQNGVTTQPPDWFSCSSWRRLADDVIAGRPAFHVACGTREFWVDQESSILVGMQTPAGQELAGVSGRATALNLGPSFPPDTFALTGPAGAVSIDPNNPPVSTILAVGRKAPRLTGTTFDGKAFDTKKQPRPLVVSFWGTWCPPCLGSPLTDLQNVATRHAAAVATATITTGDQLDAVRSYLNANGIRLPVVNDSGSMMKLWGISAVPTLVMLDRNGAVAALRVGPVSASDLEQMYAALSAGKPLPTTGVR